MKIDYVDVIEYGTNKVITRTPVYKEYNLIITDNYGRVIHNDWYESIPEIFFEMKDMDFPQAGKYRITMWNKTIIEGP